MPKTPIPETYEGLPVVTAERIRELDRIAEQRYGVPTLTLMENAGRGVAEATAAFLERAGVAPARASVVVCCGRGGKAGDGLVAGRFLRGRGAAVAAFLSPARKDGALPEPLRVNLEKAREAGVAPREYGPDCGLAEALSRADVVIDALLGTGSSGKPAGAILDMIQAMTRSKKPVIAIDLPSGLQPDTGYHSGAFVTAALTLTLALPKRGLLAAHARRCVGELRVLDIGYPPQLIKEASA